MVRQRTGGEGATTTASIQGSRQDPVALAATKFLPPHGRRRWCIARASARARRRRARAADAARRAGRRRQDRAARRAGRPRAAARPRGCRSTRPTPTAGGSGARVLEALRRAGLTRARDRWLASSPRGARDLLLAALANALGRPRRAGRARARRLPRGRRRGRACATSTCCCATRSPALRLVIATTRADPPLHLGRLRAAGPARRDPRRRPRASRSPRPASCSARSGIVAGRRRHVRAAVAAHRGLGGRAAARRAVAARPPRPGARSSTTSRATTARSATTCSPR